MTQATRLTRVEAAIHDGDFRLAKRLLTLESLEAEGRDDPKTLGRCYHLQANVAEIERRIGTAFRNWSTALFHYDRSGGGPAAERIRELLNAWTAHQTVFVSYARADEAAVRSVVDRLGAEALNVHMDQNFIAGRSIQRQIRVAIERCPKFLIFFSPAYAERSWTRFELDLYREKANCDRRAHADDCCILFFCLSGWKKVEHVIEDFEDALWVDAESDFEAAVEQLVRGLKTSVLASMP